MRKFMLFLTVLLLTLTATFVNAQDADPIGPIAPDRFLGPPNAQPPTIDIPAPANGNPIPTLLNIITAQTGLTQREITAQLRGGDTLANVIVRGGGSVDAVIEVALRIRREQLAQAITNGRIDAVGARQLFAEYEVMMRRVLTQTLRPEGAADPNTMNALRGEVELQILARIVQETDLTPQQITAAMRSGMPILEILVRSGADPQPIVEGALLTVELRLQRAVANQRITPQVAERLLTELRMGLQQALQNMPIRGSV